MFVVLLRFSDNRSAAGQHMAGHQEWIQRGLDDGVFLLVGSIQPGLGGAVLAHSTSREELESRVNADPFVAENVVKAEIIEIAPGMADDRLKFLLA
ncbi:YciI family protein [Kitasatospora azatica]|uniref:YciI family protein n=1 Tax=Kitasatospora azatica TaxID=58347 RepID=UPI00056D2179|nr:YciI family protein [Kitasatospora azatica]